VIIAVCLLTGIALRLATGRGFASLAHAELRGEPFLLGLLAAQVIVPILQLTGPSARIAYYVWLATFPCMAAIAWLNRRAPGMAILGAGLLLNSLVIALNGGMPVFGAAVAMLTSGTQVAVIPPTDFVHVLGAASTHAPWLADVVPLPGPSWMRVVASPGDLLLFAGIIAFLGGATSESDMRHSQLRGCQ
jgi:hypothetical protein